MPRYPFALLLPVLLLLAATARAQSPTTPKPAAEQVSVTVPVPRAVVLLSDCVRVLFSRDDGQDKIQALLDRRRARANKPADGLTLTLPKSKLTKALGLDE